MKFFDWRLWYSEDFLKTLKVKKLVWPWRLGIHLWNMKREDFCFRSFIFSFLSHRKHRTVKGGRGNTKEKFPCDAQLKILHLPIPSSKAIGNLIQFSQISSVTETKFFSSLRNLILKIPIVAVPCASYPKISTHLTVISLKGIYVLSCRAAP